jgi:hypothetical protein
VKSANDYADEAAKNPLGFVFKMVVIIGALVGAVMGAGIPLGWFSEAASVAKAEFGPKRSLEKYEWFKDAAQQLQKKDADISVYETRFKNMVDSYGLVPRTAWSREDREQWNLWQSEVAGITASYNALAADYNAQMQKFNWQYADTTGGIPREYKTR